MHPLMPFISEELWQRLPRRPSESHVTSIVVAAFPEVVDCLDSKEAEKEFSIYFDVVKAVRSLKTEVLKVKQAAIVTIVAKEEGLRGLLDKEEARELIVTLAKISAPYGLVAVRIKKKLFLCFWCVLIGGIDE